MDAPCLSDRPDAIARTTRLNDLFERGREALPTQPTPTAPRIYLYDEQRYRAWRGFSDKYRSATEGHSPWTPETADPRPLLVPKTHGMRASSPDLEAAVLRESHGPRCAFIPLVHDGRLLGKFTFYRDAPHE